MTVQLPLLSNGLHDAETEASNAGLAVLVEQFS
jgi:hypothetical protein